MRRTFDLFLFSTLASLFVACGSPYLDTGRLYHQWGNLPVAIEYFDAGLADNPSDEELRDALIVAEQTYQWQLRDEVDRLKENKSYLMAVVKLTELLERSKRMSTVQLPTELSEEIEVELKQLTQQAATQLSEDLDQRSNRSQVLVSDLQACRQIQALEIDDHFINRRCDLLLNQLKLVASTITTSDSHPLGHQVIEALKQKIIAQNPELLGFTKPSAKDRNAQMHLKLGPYSQSDTGWYLSGRDTYHTWVKKLDKKGRPITRRVAVPAPPPTKKVEQNQKKEKEEKKFEDKQVWIQIRGDYRFYQNQRNISLPFQLTLVDLRDNSQVVAYEGHVQSQSIRRYFDFLGHPRARKTINNRGREGQHTAPPLESVDTLLRQAAGNISTPLAKVILKRIE